jgi:hypothetical protein
MHQINRDQNVFGTIVKVLQSYAFARCKVDGREFDVFLHPKNFALVELPSDCRKEVFRIVGNGTFENNGLIVVRLAAEPPANGRAWPADAWAYKFDWNGVVDKLVSNGNENVPNGDPRNGLVSLTKPSRFVEKVSSTHVGAKPPDDAPVEEILLWQAMGGANAGVHHAKHVKHAGPRKQARYRY